MHFLLTKKLSIGDEITGQQILEKYVNAYFAERLNLYLQHPRLRQAFFDIDNNKVGSTHESL